MSARPKNTQAAIYAETGDGCSSSTVGCCALLLWLFLLVLPFLTMKLEMVMFVEAFVAEVDYDEVVEADYYYYYNEIVVGFH